MATLEKIRSKSVLLFTVIIVALLAFILGDFLTRGSQMLGTGDTVASANGVKVDYKTYSDRVNQHSQSQQGRNQDNDALSQQTINELLIEGLLQQEYDKMGITVTDKQINAIIADPNQQLGLMQAIFTNLGPEAGQALFNRGLRTPADFRAAIDNPAKYGLQPQEAEAIRTIWVDLEKNLDSQLRSSAYQNLIAGLFTANQVDARAAYNDVNTKTEFSYVRKDLTAVTDKDAEPTDADYQKLYEEHKGAFKIDEENRVISYIVVPIAPSDKDFAAGEAEVVEVLNALTNQEGVTGLHSHKGFAQETAKYTREKLAQDPQLRSLTAGTDSLGLAPGRVARTMAINGNYVLAKVLDAGTGIDRVKFTFFGGQKAEVDSILAKTSVAAFDSIATSKGGQTLEFSLIAPQEQLPENLLNDLATKPVGEIFTLTDTVATQDGKSQVVERAFLINERDAATPYYQIAKVTYTVTPSQATITDLNNKFHAYVAKNATAKAFSDNAEKEGYIVGQTIVAPSVPLVAGQIPSSRPAIKWAMDNKQGKVSPVFNNNDYLMAIAIDEVFDGKYMPITSAYVRKMLKPQVMNIKKGEKLVAQYAGKAKDLNGYAKVMGAPVAKGGEVFASNMIEGLSMPDLTLAGVVAGSAKGKVVGPFAGDNGVYVIVVNNQTKEGRPYNYQESAANFGNNVVKNVFSDPLKLLLGDKKVKNNILKFTADAE